MRQDSDNKFTAKIIRAPALLNDSKIFLSTWDEKLSIEQNLQIATQQNIFGRRARSYVKQILESFRERFIFGDERDRALRRLVKSPLHPDIIDKILYCHTAIADPLLYHFVTDFLYELQTLDRKTISTREAQDYISKLAREGKTTTVWSDTVCNRVARNILTSLRDFHILDGAVKKYIAPVYMPIETFVYVAFHVYKKVKSGEKVLQHNDWKLYLLDAFSVERLFMEAQQNKFLNYQAAGNIIRISFKQQSYEELADAIIARATQSA